MKVFQRLAHAFKAEGVDATFGMMGDGNMFCCEISKAANCYVYASTETQWATSGATLPFGMLDTFEGLLLCYGPPRGEIVWQTRYSSQWRGD